MLKRCGYTGEKHSLPITVRSVFLFDACPSPQEAWFEYGSNEAPLSGC